MDKITQCEKFSFYYRGICCTEIACPYYIMDKARRRTLQLYSTKKNIKKGDDKWV